MGNESSDIPPPPISLSVQYNTNSIPFPSPMAFESYHEHIIGDKVSVSNPFKKDRIVYVNASNSTNPSNIYGSTQVMTPSAEQTYFSGDGDANGITNSTKTEIPIYYEQSGRIKKDIPSIETQVNALSCHSDDVYNVSVQNVSIQTYKSPNDHMIDSQKISPPRNPLSHAMMNSLQVPTGHALNVPSVVSNTSPRTVTVSKDLSIPHPPSLALSVSSKTSEYNSSNFEGVNSSTTLKMGNITITRVSADGNSKCTERSLAYYGHPSVTDDE